MCEAKDGFRALQSIDHDVAHADMANLLEASRISEKGLESEVESWG